MTDIDKRLILSNCNSAHLQKHGVNCRSQQNMSTFSIILQSANGLIPDIYRNSPKCLWNHFIIEKISQDLAIFCCSFQLRSPNKKLYCCEFFRLRNESRDSHQLSVNLPLESVYRIIQGRAEDGLVSHSLCDNKRKTYTERDKEDEGYLIMGLKGQGQE